MIKFAGNYHGHVDALLASGGSGLMTLGIPSTPGVPVGRRRRHDRAARSTTSTPSRRPWPQYGEGLAAILVEPVAGNMGVVPPAPGFLEALRLLCDASGALLVFDEVITGFRVARGGAQERYGVMPDLTILGKIVGGGLPAAAFGGRAELMQRLAPVGDVYQAGTLSGQSRSRPPPAPRCCAGSATRRSTRSSSAAAPGSRRASPPSAPSSASARC